ncbi:MAG: ABC transporter ATP-binding protein [Acidobacteriota bacterium]
MSSVVQFEKLEVRFGKRRILNGISAALKGKSIGLLGPNGAGKTTLLHTLLGFHKPWSGTVTLFGKSIHEAPREMRRLVGYMPENDAFIAGMSAVRFLRLMGELSGLPAKHALERAHETLFYVGLGEARYRNLETYSLGMKQMAKLAQAIIHGPKLLILDEPTNGLDPPHRARMIELIREIREQGDMTLILSSHLLRDVEECCEEVLVLKEGDVVAHSDLAAERNANRRLLELETVGDNAGFAAALTALGCTLATSGKRGMKVVLPERIEIRDLYQAAAARDVQIRRLAPKETSLEEIFLKAMGETHGSL